MPPTARKTLSSSTDIGTLFSGAWVYLRCWPLSLRGCTNEKVDIKTPETAFSPFPSFHPSILPFLCISFFCVCVFILLPSFGEDYKRNLLFSRLLNFLHFLWKPGAVVRTVMARNHVSCACIDTKSLYEAGNRILITSSHWESGPPRSPPPPPSLTQRSSNIETGLRQKKPIKY